MNARPSIVVTGAAGFIGRRVVDRLARTEADLTAMDRVADPGGWPAGVDYRQMDLDREMPGFKGKWVLVHLAWSLDRANVAAQQESLRTFARLLGQDGLAGVVGLGSAEEYGEREGRLREDMAPGAKLSAYGQAKHAAGKALEAWARGAGRKAVWLWPFVVYGPGQGADGIAAATLALPTLKPAFAACNLGRGEPVRLRDVLERIADQMNARELFRFGARPMRPGEPQEQYADVAAAAELFGWRAKIPWQQGIDALCREPGKDNHG